MKKLVFAGLFALTLAPIMAMAAPVHDWHDLDAVHKHVIESIHEMERARARNHYDMDGHGTRAEDLLRQSEHELGLAVQSARAAH